MPYHKAMPSIRPSRVLLFIVLLVSVAACGSGESRSGEVVTHEVRVRGEDLLFDTEQLTVADGQTVRIKFHNSATTTEHNWVLVRGGAEVAEQVDRAGKIAGPSRGYIPDDMGDIIDHTRLLNAGEQTEITFDAPLPGTYVYLCTVPGHYEAGMRGELVVTP